MPKATCAFASSRLSAQAPVAKNPRRSRATTCDLSVMAARLVPDVPQLLPDGLRALHRGAIHGESVPTHHPLHNVFQTAHHLTGYPLARGLPLGTPRARRGLRAERDRRIRPPASPPRRFEASRRFVVGVCV